MKDDQKVVPKPKPTKIRFEPLRPGDVIDLLKPFLSSIRENPWPYPSLTEHTSEDLADWLFFLLSQPTFTGVGVKSGRKFVGYVLGSMHSRPIGRPKHFATIVSAWLEPELRTEPNVRALKTEYLKRVKESGVHHWEANLADKLVLDFFGGPKGEIAFSREV